MSLNKSRDIGNLRDLIDHLAKIEFSGTLNVAFRNGSPYSISRKEEMTPEMLQQFLNRPMAIKVKKKEKEPLAEQETIIEQNQGEETNHGGQGEETPSEPA